MADPQPQNNPNDESPQQRSLSEIGHLFLSSVRDRHMGDSPRPQRTPPGAPRAGTPINLSQDEFARAFEAAATAAPRDIVSKQPAAKSSGEHSFEHIPPVTAVLAPHLNGTQRQRVREYAAHLCKSGERIGLIELDALEFRLSCFELGSSVAADEATVCDSLDSRRISEALEEMSWDVDRWLLNIPNPRLNEARALLEHIDCWTVLATCDHDGVVACYRSLKGLSDLHRHDELARRKSQKLSLALLDADDDAEAAHVFQKLAGVCRQFLHWPLESEAAVLAAGSVVEHQVLVCRSSHGRTETSPQWNIVEAFLTRSAAPGTALSQDGAPIAANEPNRRIVSDEVAPARPAGAPTSGGTVISAEPATAIRMAADDLENQPIQYPVAASELPLFADVIDLPSGADTAAGITAATLHGESGLVECPVKPPMLADASLAVARDRRLILLAVAKQGLSDLRLIGEAWRWMNENRALIAMAVPQLSIDPHQMPHLRLLVDRADLSASTLQPLLQSGNVTVNTYRKLRWGAKTGLLLEAA